MWEKQTQLFHFDIDHERNPGFGTAHDGTSSDSHGFDQFDHKNYIYVCTIQIFQLTVYQNLSIAEVIRVMQESEMSKPFEYVTRQCNLLSHEED